MLYRVIPPGDREEWKKTSVQELRVPRWESRGGPIHVSRKVDQSGLEKKSVGTLARAPHYLLASLCPVVLNH